MQVTLEPPRPAAPGRPAPMSERVRVIEELALRARAGDAGALAELVARLEGVVKLSTRGLWLAAGGDREDLMQEARLGIIRAVATWRPERRRFLSFAFFCVRRQVAASLRDHGRRKHRVLTDALSASLDAGATLPSGNGKPRLARMANPGAGNPEETVLEEETQAAVLRFLRDLRGRLTDLEWNAAWLVLGEGRSYKDAALALGRRIKAVDNAVQRARRKAWVRAAAMASDSRWTHVLDQLPIRSPGEPGGADSRLTPRELPV